MKTTVVEQCEYIALAVRKALLRSFPKNTRCVSLCSVATCAICIVAERMKIEGVRFAGGTFSSVPELTRPEFGNPEHIAAKRSARGAAHAWVHVRQNYIDATLTQFIDCEPVVVTEESDPRFNLLGYKTIEDVFGMLFLLGWDEKHVHRAVDRALRMIEKDEVYEAA